MISRRFFALAAILFATFSTGAAADDWPQYQFDSRRSGNAEENAVPTGEIGLRYYAALGDAIFTAPAIVDGKVFVVDGGGTAYCLDLKTFRQVWKTPTDASGANCNNVSSPLVVAGKVHFGTTGGVYYVLDAATGKVNKKIDCGEPIFSSPASDGERVYFVTAGSKAFALSPEGESIWTWDYVREVLRFDGDRWSGTDWAKRGTGHVTWRDQFVCSREIGLYDKTLVIPAGGSIIWLKDEGGAAKLTGRFAPKESPATYGLSIGDDGTVFRQWYRRDNIGRVETLLLAGDKIKSGFVAGTETRYDGDHSLSFSSVALRGNSVYRTRPEEGFGLCRHSIGETKADETKTNAAIEPLGAYPSYAPPVLSGDQAIVSGMNGTLYIVPLDGKSPARTYETIFHRPIYAPAAVADGQVVFCSEDGHVYSLAAGVDYKPPALKPDLTSIRSPLQGEFTDGKYDWFTNFGDLTNANRSAEQELAGPTRVKWIRRVDGTIKHASVSGAGRIYTHTAEGQIFAVEAETGRLLWRTFYPGVHVSYTAPIYHDGRLLVPQAGLEKCRLRCLDAASGKLLWEKPFAGSPSWNRQLPPVVAGDLAIYQFSNARYDGKGWLFEHQQTTGFPKDHRPLVKAWNVKTGAEAWSLDFSADGAGGDDAGMCLEDGVLYYSCYFGDEGRPGVTAAIEPATGKILWKTTEYAVHGGCTPSVKNGRLYLGGYNAVDGKTNRIWCLDAKTGKLVWQSDPLGWAIHVVTIGESFAFTHAQYKTSTLLNLVDGTKICNVTEGYNCTRFTMAGRYLLGSNMDVYDTSGNQAKLVSTGPAVDVITCTGAHVSNGRIVFTANGGGLQLSMAYGAEAEKLIAERAK